MTEPMIADEGCWERGCACHDSRDSPGVELVRKREWVGLTEEEIKAAWSQLYCDINKMKLAADDRPQKETVGFIFAKAVEAKLKVRNT